MKRTILLAAMILFLFSCSKRTTIQQVDFDLKGMLENKAEVQNLEIIERIPFSEDGQELDSIYFDCDLSFTDDLFTDDFKFSRGMKVATKSNVFVYDQSNRLVALKFGKIRLK